VVQVKYYLLTQTQVLNQDRVFMLPLIEVEDYIDAEKYQV
jgi:hypothetical protein